jgi:hypothetical protein
MIAWGHKRNRPRSGPKPDDPAEADRPSTVKHAGSLIAQPPRTDQELASR